MKRILLAYTLSALCLLPAFAGGGEGSLPISYVNPSVLPTLVPLIRERSVPMV